MIVGNVGEGLGNEGKRGVSVGDRGRENEK